VLDHYGKRIIITLPHMSSYNDEDNDDNENKDNNNDHDISDDESLKHFTI